jgi:hypothetical protein
VELLSGTVPKRDVQFRWFGLTHAACFTGGELLDALLAHGPALGVTDRPSALALARRLAAARLVVRVADALPSIEECGVADGGGRRYRLMADAPRAPPYGAPLNAHFWWPAPARDAVTARARLACCLITAALAAAACAPLSAASPDRRRPRPASKTTTTKNPFNYSRCRRTCAPASSRCTTRTCRPTAAPSTTAR